MERCIGGKACLERTLMGLEPQISVDINGLWNLQQILLYLSNQKNPSKSMTLKDF